MALYRILLRSQSPSDEDATNRRGKQGLFGTNVQVAEFTVHYWENIMRKMLLTALTATVLLSSATFAAAVDGLGLVQKTAVVCGYLGCVRPIVDITDVTGINRTVTGGIARHW
jgi:hypothetical protein